MNRFLNRLRKLNVQVPEKNPYESPEAVRAWCIANGHAPDSVVLGLRPGASMVIILPPERPE